MHNLLSLYLDFIEYIRVYTSQYAYLKQEQLSHYQSVPLCKVILERQRLKTLFTTVKYSPKF